MKKLFLFLVFAISFSFIAFAQLPEKPDNLKTNKSYFAKGSMESINLDLSMSGIDNRHEYFKAVPVLIQTKDENKKSLFLAGLFSAVVPGTGELYTGNYWQSALFLGIEAASWIINAKYNKKGDDQTAFYKSYADEHWSVMRYATWVESNLDKIVPDQTNIDKCRVLFQSLYKSGNLPQEKINWDKLNEIERIIGSGGGKGQAFSHTLPKYGDQQYFELIGKYPQYSQGWDDSDQNSNGDFYDRVTQNFRYYSSERGKANEFYNTASTFASIIVLNHLVSAIDAVLMAHFHNKARVSVTYNNIYTPDGKFQLNPNLNLSINF